MRHKTGETLSYTHNKMVNIMMEVKNIPDSYEDRLVWFSTDDSPAYDSMYVEEDGQVVRKFGGKLRGKFISLPGESHVKETAEEAVDLAMRFRDECLDEACERGLLHS